MEKRANLGNFPLCAITLESSEQATHILIFHFVNVAPNGFTHSLSGSRNQPLNYDRDPIFHFENMTVFIFTSSHCLFQ